MLASLLAVCMSAPLLMKKADNGKKIPDNTPRGSTMFVMSRQQQQTAAKV